MFLTFDNIRVAIPAAFEKEKDAWDAIQDVVKQANRPRFGWVQKVVEHAVG